MFTDLENKKFKKQITDSQEVKVEEKKDFKKEEKIVIENLENPNKILEDIIKKRKDKENIKLEITDVEKKVEKKDEEEDEDEIFTKTGTKLEGKNKILLKAKIQQYKSLFKDKLKKFKIKKNATEEELQDYLNEMEILVNVSDFDDFLLESILACLKMAENVSKITKYDISGTADLLKANPQFNSIAKQLFIKYKIFNNISVEYQLIMLVGVTASFSIIKNKREKELFFNSTC
jgi:hypothetical protein